MEALIRLEYIICRAKVNSTYIFNSNISTVHSFQSAIYRRFRCLSRLKIEGVQILNGKIRTCPYENIISLAIPIVILIILGPSHCPICSFITSKCDICTISCCLDWILVISYIILCQMNGLSASVLFPCAGRVNI